MSNQDLSATVEETQFAQILLATVDEQLRIANTVVAMALADAEGREPLTVSQRNRLYDLMDALGPLLERHALMLFGPGMHGVLQ